MLKNYQLFCEVIELIGKIFNHIVFRCLLYQVEMPQAMDLQQDFPNINQIKYGQFSRILNSYQEKKKRSKSKSLSAAAAYQNNNNNYNGNENINPNVTANANGIVTKSICVNIDNYNGNGNKTKSTNKNKNSNGNSNSNSNDSDCDISMGYGLKVNEINEPIDVYGGEHLLRLFIKLPQLVGKFINFKQGHAIMIKEKCNVFIKYLSLQQNSKYFEYCNEESPNEFDKLIELDSDYFKWIGKIQISNH